MSDPEWKTGDRVRLDPSIAIGYVQPYRKIIEEGRLGTLYVGTQGSLAGTVTVTKITWDTKRKGSKTQDMWLDKYTLRHLERV